MLPVSDNNSSISCADDKVIIAEIPQLLQIIVQTGAGKRKTWMMHQNKPHANRENPIDPTIENFGQWEHS